MQALRLIRILRKRDDLETVSVERLTHDGPQVEERYRCSSAGTLEVALTVLDDGYSQTFKVARPARRAH